MGNEVMDNETLIAELEDWAAVEGKGTRYYVLKMAAQRIEEMQERISIISENLDAVEQEFDEFLQEIGVREG